MRNKISTLKELSKIAKIAKLKKKKIVLCHGVFDLMHLGHIKHFQEAKRLGDILIVTVTPDRFVNKGPNRPIFQSQMRMQALSGLSSIDYVAENNWETALETIKMIKPNIYCKGPDYKDHRNDITQKIKDEVKVAKSVKAQIRYTSGITFSSSSIINSYSDALDKSQRAFIKKVNTILNFKKIKSDMDKLKKLKVLVNIQLPIPVMKLSS